ncbi:MAG: TolC family protein [Phycisphaeraceae bacterium]|nr:TolC family protein [Phycisphaeraceae bacterium]
MKRVLGTLAWVTVMTGLGCAGRAERDAFSAWTRIDREVYESRGLSATRPASDDGSTPAAPLAWPLTMEGAVGYALENNPGVRGAFLTWRGAMEKVPQARALPDPRVSYGYDGMDRQDTYGVSQMLVWPGKLEAREQAAVEMARAERARYEAARLEVVRRVRQAYAELAYARGAVGVMERNVRLAEESAGTLRGQYEAGAGEQGAWLRAEMDRARMQSDLESMAEMVGAIEGQLNAALGRAGAAEVGEIAGVEKIEPTREEERVLIERLRARNPRLAAMAHEVSSAGRMVRAARLEPIPDVEVGVQYMRDEMMDAIGAMVSLNVPLWMEKYEGMRRQALAEFGAAGLRRANDQNMLEEELRMAVYRLREAQRRVELFGDRLLPRAREVEAANEAGYRSGMMGYIETSMARRDLLEFELGHLRAVSDRVSAWARIEELVGSGE